MRAASSFPDKLWGTDCQTHVMSVGDPRMSLNSAIPAACCRVVKHALSFFNCMEPGAETLKYIIYAATVTRNRSRGDMLNPNKEMIASGANFRAVLLIPIP
jgi:hypothetical protein